MLVGLLCTFVFCIISFYHEILNPNSCFILINGYSQWYNRHISEHGLDRTATLFILLVFIFILVPIAL